MNADTLALARMDDDGWGCAVVTEPDPTAAELAAYLAVKHEWEHLVVLHSRAQTEVIRLRDLRDLAGTRFDALKQAGGPGRPGDAPCCQRYGRLHEPVFALYGCRWYDHPHFTEGAS